MVPQELPFTMVIAGAASHQEHSALVSTQPCSGLSLEAMGLCWETPSWSVLLQQSFPEPLSQVANVLEVQSANVLEGQS